MFDTNGRTTKRYIVGLDLYRAAVWGYFTIVSVQYKSLRNGLGFCLPLDGVRGGMQKGVFVKCSGAKLLFRKNYPHKNGLY